MEEVVQLFPKAFSVRFAQINRWDPNSFHGVNWHWPISVMAKIESVLNPRKEKVDRSAYAFSDLMPVTIHFDGSIEPRKVSEDKEYTMELFWARPGDIVVSKIDLKNGAVAIIPDEWNRVVVTNHFAVYEPNLEKIDPRYFHLLIQAKFFKEHLWRNKVGAEGRKEVKLDFFESLEVPIPPLPIQKKIIGYYEAAQAVANSSQQKICDYEEISTQELLSKAGISIAIGEKLPKVFCKSFKEQERWGIDFNRFSWSLGSLINSKIYKTAPLFNFAYVNPTTDIKLADADLVTFIPMEAVSDKDGVILSPVLKKLIEVKKGYTRFKNGDVIWAKITPCMQNGKSAVVSGLENGIGFGSTEFHVIRSKDNRLLNNGFIHLLLRLPEIRQAATRYFVGSAGQQRVPKDFLEGLHIPIPPLQVQIDIVKKYAAVREKITDTRKSIYYEGYKSAREIEQMILGTLHVEAH